MIKEDSPKLVRDKIPEIYKSDNWIYHTANDGNEYYKYLKKKLLEEVEEFLIEENLDEMADILEVLDAFSMLKNWTKEEILQTKFNKAEKRGAFVNRIIATKI